MKRAPRPKCLDKTLAAHSAEIAQLRSENAKLLHLISEQQQQIAGLEEQLRLERAHRYGPRSEKKVDRIFNEAEQAAAEEAEGGEAFDAEVPDTGLEPGERPEPRKRGRKRLSADLPRQRVEYDLAEDQKICACCAHALHRIGESVTEQLQIEVKATVLENARFKYGCRNCERNGIEVPIMIAPMPAQPMPGSVATASTLALVLASKYVDGLPLYRLSQALGRTGVELSRGTLGHWVIRSSELHFERIFASLKARLVGQNVIHGDETWVQVLKEDGRPAQTKSYVWAYRTAQDSAEPIVLFDYQPGRGQHYPQAFLAGFCGTLMTDGYEAWRTLPGAVHLGCMAHARRKFTDALKARKKPGGPAVTAIKFFEALYEVERLASQSPLPDGEARAEFTLRRRQQHSVPVLTAFKAWLDAVAPQVLPESLAGKAIAYTRGQWDHLVRYADDGRAPIDNNLLERDIRKFVTGRKGWLFSDTPAGAKSSAVIYSLVLTCRAAGVDPYDWLEYVITKLPQRGPNDDIDDLLPFNFKPDQANQPPG
jgi:transposase